MLHDSGEAEETSQTSTSNIVTGIMQMMVKGENTDGITVNNCGENTSHLTDYDETKKICGTQVSGNHITMSDTKGKVYGKGTVLHCGRTSHIWNVDIVAEDGTLISTERVENRILF